MKKILILLVFTNYFLTGVFSQIIVDTATSNRFNTIQEQIQLVTDRSLYLSGETIWFSGINVFSDGSGFGISRILYLEITDLSQKSIVQKKFRIEEGYFSGHLFIPEESLSGVYFLRAFTQYNKNKKTGNLFILPITVINPERPVSNREVSASGLNVKPDSISVRNQPDDSVTISFSGLKQVYSQRENVSFSINTDSTETSGFTHWCLSVAKTGTNIYSSIDMTAENQSREESKPESLFWLPEIRDVSISGMIKNRKNGIPESNTAVYLSVIGQNPQFQATRSGKHGEFIFSLPNIPDSAEIIISTEPDSISRYEILINKDFPEVNPVTLGDYSLPDEQSRELLTSMYINMQLSKSLKDVKKEVPETRDDFLFGTPDYSVKLKDYIELSSLAEVFKEVVPQVAAKRRTGDTPCCY